jgi:thymidylate synthase
MEKFIALIQHDDEFAEKWGDLGKVYGKQWRSWYGGIGLDDEEYNIDQIQNLIDGLKSNPDSRRLMVSAWNVGELDQMTLPPCHYGFQIYTRELSEDEKIDLLPEKKGWDDYDTLSFKEKIEKGPQRAISLMWNQRSVDTPLGLPFNIASYGLLLMMIAQEVNMVPDELIGNLGDCHIYLNQIEGVKEQIGRELTDEERYDIWFTNNYETGMERFFNPEKLPDFENSYYTPTPKRTREPYPLPTVRVQDGIHCSSVNDVLLENYQSQPPIKFPLSN